jgi:two-component sensor histidine kinase
VTACISLISGTGAVDGNFSVKPLNRAWDIKHLRIATDAAGVALWSWNVDTDEINMDDRGFDLWGEPKRDKITFADLSSHIHPADRDRVAAAFNATRARLGAYELDFRVNVLDEIRWVAARGKGDDEGIIGRVMYGVFLDVTSRKNAEEAHALLAEEMSHRVKNLLAIACGLTAITSRAADSAPAMAHDLTQRLMALGRAHDLVRPSPGKGENEALLGDLLSVLLAPYDGMGDFTGRVRVSVPKMIVGEASATTLALAIHELATNALKYGSLSAAAGMLDISCHIDGRDLILIWTETGGPRVIAPESKSGFGSKLLNRGISGQLGGSIIFDWQPEGVIITMRLDQDRLAS